MAGHRAERRCRSRVTQGTVLATTSGSGNPQALAAAQAALDAAQAKLAQDQAKPTPDDVARAQTTLQQAQQTLAGAQQSLTDAQAHGTASVNAAQTSASEANDTLQRDINAGATSALIAADRRAVAQTAGALQTAKASADAANNKAQSDVDAATLGLQSAQEAYNSATAPAPPALIASDQAAVASAQQALTPLQASSNTGQLVAPADGEITQVSIAVGGTAPSGDAIQMESAPTLVTAPFSENDIASIAVGQSASVSVGALRQQLTAKVTRASVLPSTTTGSTVVTYPVTVTLDSTPAQLRPGMTATVQITTANANGVLAVPTVALQGANDAYTVRVLNADGSVNAVPVQVGLISDTLAEIKSGLNAGDKVIVGTISSGH